MDKNREICEFCEGSKMPGILLTDFDDREASCDGKVFVCRCDTCRIYEDDVEAAEAASEATGWEVKKSYDRDEDYDLESRKEKAGTEYYRPYFAVTVQQVEAAIN